MTLAERLVQQGKFEGWLEGWLEVKLEIAKHLLAENMGFSFISRVTGLSIGKIEQLKTRKEFTV